MRNSISGAVLFLACVIVCGGCAGGSPQVLRYGETGYSIPTLTPAQSGRLAKWRERMNYRNSNFPDSLDVPDYAATNRSTDLGGAKSSWGELAYTMNGHKVVERYYAPAGEPTLRVVSADGEYGGYPALGVADVRMRERGLPVADAWDARPRHKSTPAAHFYGDSFFAFDAGADAVSAAVRAVADAEGWTATADDRVSADPSLTIDQHAFTDAQGRAVTVETVAPANRPTLVVVDYATGDPNDPMKVYNGVREQLHLPITSPAGSVATPREAVAAR